MDLCFPFEPKHLHSHDTPGEILNVFAKILPFQIYTALLNEMAETPLLAQTSNQHCKDQGSLEGSSSQL